MRRINFLTLFAIFLYFSCDQNPEKKEKDSFIEEKVKPIKTNSSIVKQYESLLDSADTFEKKILNKILFNINSFGDKPFLNEYLTIGNIDGIGELDTIRTTVLVKEDTVFLESKWFRDKHLLWKNELVNPYMWISDNDLFEYNSGDIWARLTIAKDYSIPELSPKSNYAHIPVKMAINIGLSKLKDKKMNVNKETYTKYIEDFKGDLLEFGEPEMRNLVIWYEPVKDFVTFYAP